MVAKFLDLSKHGPADNEKHDAYNVPVHDCSRNHTISHTFHPLFDDADGPVCQEFCYHGNVMSHFSFLLPKALNTSTVFSDLSLHTLDSLHTENTVFCSGCTAHGFPMMHCSLGQCKLQTAD